jgi:hypothetical protein
LAKNAHPERKGKSLRLDPKTREVIMQVDAADFALYKHLNRKKMIRYLVTASAVCFFSFLITLARAASDHPIVGVWEWTRKENNCTETYTYRKDGASLVESAQERNEDKYEISDTAEGSNRHRMKVTTTKDNGGKDCAGNDKDNTGQSATVYVEFDSNYTQMIVCLDATSFKCFGPLKRVSR